MQSQKEMITAGGAHQSYWQDANNIGDNAIKHIQNEVVNNGGVASKEYMMTR